MRNRRRVRARRGESFRHERPASPAVVAPATAYGLGRFLTPGRARMKGLACLVALAVLGAGGCTNAVKTTAHDPVGTTELKPTLQDKDAGLVAMAPGFELKAYGAIGVDRFLVSPTETKDKGDRDLAVSMPGYFQAEIVSRLARTKVFARVVNLSEASLNLGPEKALRLTGVITRLAPGSRTLRFFVGYGVGRSKAQVEMHFIDVQSGQVVMVTADRRVAAHGLFGGDSEGHLRESFEEMARDLSRFLQRLAKEG
jgi:hypothetical protein